MMQTIDDAKAMENEDIVEEEDAQTGYENFVKDSNASRSSPISLLPTVSCTSAVILL